MSSKDKNYCRKCVICGDVLPGTDDGLEVYESLKEQVEQNQAAPNCTLCGEEVDGGLEVARKLVALGEPKLNGITTY